MTESEPPDREEVEGTGSETASEASALSRLRAWFRRAAEHLRPTDTAWQGVRTAWKLLAWVLVVAVLVTEALPDFWWGKLFGIVLLLLLPLGIGRLSRRILRWLARIPLAVRDSLLVVLPLFLMLFMASSGPKGGAILAGALLLLSALLGGALAALRRAGWRPTEARKATTVAVLGLVLLGAGSWFLFRVGEDPNPTLEDAARPKRSLPLSNPGQPGPFAVELLTYGSGEDRHRPEYGEDVDVVTDSVDGSKLVERWEGRSGWLRTRFWGFDATALPLQGRVWMPEGPGPFPITLIVHGNHGMEDFSDGGYAYLGELLASRGTIVVSVDENFLNSSASDLIGVPDVGLDEENDLRGWLLLEHLAQWRRWNRESGHVFAGRVDLDRVVLIGHSRGGEAVAAAAAFNDLDRYPDDATVVFGYRFGVKGVLAIAPIDGQYEPRGRGTPLKGVSYFTIHGSQDGDVQSFEGTTQFSRTTLSPDSELQFKATLYVHGANHGQFNTSWGRNDFGGGFFGWPLDTRPILPPDDQRRIAKVFFSAFLEVLLHDRPGYLPVFRDAAAAGDWLPETFLVQDYEDNRTLSFADFEEDLDPATGSITGSRIDEKGLTRWREEWVSLKWDPLASHVAVVAWDDRAGEETAEWGFTLASPRPAPESSCIVVSLADANEDSLPPDHDGDGEAEDDEDDRDDDPEALDWTVRLVDADGRIGDVGLGTQRLLHPQVDSQTRWADFLNETATREPVFQHWCLPIDEFAAANPELDLARLAGVRFVFDRSPRGAILVDRLGLGNLPARDASPTVVPVDGAGTSQ